MTSLIGSLVFVEPISSEANSTVSSIHEYLNNSIGIINEHKNTGLTWREPDVMLTQWSAEHLETLM
jgi:hypothetical protein